MMKKLLNHPDIEKRVDVGERHRTKLNNIKAGVCRECGARFLWDKNRCFSCAKLRRELRRNKRNQHTKYNTASYRKMAQVTVIVSHPSDTAAKQSILDQKDRLPKPDSVRVSSAHYKGFFPFKCHCTLTK